VPKTNFKKLNYFNYLFVIEKKNEHKKCQIFRQNTDGSTFNLSQKNIIFDH